MCSIFIITILFKYKICRVLLVGILALLTVPVLYFYTKTPPPVPDLDLEEWWGTKLSRSKQNNSIVPFKVEFSDLNIKDIKERLRDRHPLTPPLEGVAFEYGFNSKHLESWLKYWADEYPYSERETYINKYPHFKTHIQGLNIHFIRIKPEKVPAGKEVLPLLLLHGWPGSFLEFYGAIPHLSAVSKDRDFVLELIIPSLPGYGFSSAAARPGLGADKMAVVMKNLMNRLGHKKYYVQGGDWGAVIGNLMATFFPQEVLGYHTNMPFLSTTASTVIRVLGSIYPPLVVSSEAADRMYPMSRYFAMLMEETGYFHIQATKPDTVGIALSDSPAGLAAYILEKFSTWTRLEHRTKPDGGLTYRFTKDQLIDNLMVYWVSNSITTSMRMYAETFNKRHLSQNYDEIPTSVPTWVLQAKQEITYLPGWVLKFKYTNLLNETILQDGGHFLAMELPEIFSTNVLQAVDAFRKWHEQQHRTEL